MNFTAVIAEDEPLLPAERAARPAETLPELEIHKGFFLVVR